MERIYNALASFQELLREIERLDPTIDAGRLQRETVKPALDELRALWRARQVQCGTRVYWHEPEGLQ